WRALGLPYVAAMAQLGGDLYVKKAVLEYHGSAAFDDVLQVALKCQRIGTSSITFVGAVFRGDQTLVTGEIIYVFADPRTQQSQPVPDALRQLLTAFEGGQPAVAITLGAWTTLDKQASRVRTAVFVQEQGIPAELEWDLSDLTALHAVATNGLGQVVGTARLVRQATGLARIGRMAVTRELRGAGLGQQLLRVLEAAAAARGDTEVMLHAQQSAQGFYLRMGYTTRGPTFEEVGIPHIEMTKCLAMS
ncbi:MAG: GNAT family N-acetyltransferase, partial [Polaromonas sp.]|nr:GNAT family N-acetyltransferase [Polaromonas sp.]